MEASGLINPDAGYALIVNYLPPSFTDHDLHQLFTDVGPLLSAKVMRNKVSKRDLDAIKCLIHVKIRSNFAIPKD